jgi:hypothetical protein
MKASVIAFAAAVLACAGCATINRATDYHGMGIESGEKPLETVEIENTGWLLFKCIPLGSGDPLHPNLRSCRMFRNTVTLQNNLEMLEDEMERVGAKRVANLTSRKTDETVFVILFTRRAYHTSAVLLK